MFDLSWSELLLIGVVALVVIGPKELPGVLRTLGQWMSKVRRMASEFQNQFHDAMREAELADLKKEVEQMTAQASNYSMDPLADVRKDMENAQREIESAVAGTPAARPTVSDVAAPQAPPAEPAEAAPASEPAPVSQSAGAAEEHAKEAAEPPSKPSGAGSAPA